jgi:hypothetical protein
VHHDPLLLGHEQSRWTLQAIAQSCDWLMLYTLGGLSRLLDRLGIRYKRARPYIHSPDLCYDEKVGLIQRCLLRAWYAPEQYVFLYQDELSYYRQPTLAAAYEAKGHAQPLAYLSQHTNNCFRIVAGLNVVTGQLIAQQHSHIGVERLCEFYDAVCAAYPQAQEIYVALDNWPVHFHADVLAHLQPQDFPWPPKLPAHWPTRPSRNAVRAELPIHLLCLPTYAPWLNPVEKLWRWLKQNVLHLHRLSSDWITLQQRVADVLDQFTPGSTYLLHYVGLLPS